MYCISLVGRGKKKWISLCCEWNPATWCGWWL